LYDDIFIEIRGDGEFIDGTATDIKTGVETVLLTQLKKDLFKIKIGDDDVLMENLYLLTAGECERDIFVLELKKGPDLVNRVDKETGVCVLLPSKVGETVRSGVAVILCEIDI
jgi:hypothetical protein